MNDALNVYWEDGKIGRLWLTADRTFIFQYDPSWVSSSEALPISLRLPLRTAPFEADASKPFFSNLLPEANIRQMIARKLGISEGNDFKLLEALGGECAGALSLLPDERDPDKAGDYEPVSASALDKMIEEMPRRPLLAAKEGLRLSLAGAQHKVPVYVRDGSIFLPHGALSSSHILKPEIPNLKNTVENEAFCMMLAKECGLPVPAVEIREGKNRALLVRRYDRTLAAGSPARLHQEDFCQALGYSYEQKYETDGGPSIKDCCLLLEEYSSQPIIDKRNLLRRVIFNHIIGNCDAHAKNISILITRDGIRLAPFYDLMCTRVYPNLDKKSAMKIGGENRPDWIMKRHWERLAEDADVGVKAVLGICDDLAETLPTAAKKLERAFVPKYGAQEVVGKITQDALGMIKLLGERLAEKESQAIAESAEESAAKFSPEIRGADEFLYGPIASRFIHRGGWELHAHPIEYRAERFADPQDVKRLVEASEIGLRGWNFPHTDKKDSRYFLKGYQSLTDWDDLVEGYRACQSGLFVWKRVIREDLENRKDSQGRKVMSFVNVIWQITEIFLFLKRYYDQRTSTAGVRVRLTLNGMMNRSLVSLQTGILWFPEGLISQEPQIILEEDITPKDLANSSVDIANRWIRRIFLMFGWDESLEEFVTGWQKKLIERKI